MINKLTEKLKGFEQVEAIALGGSRASGNSDPGSDYDIYVYCTDKLPEDKHRAMLEELCSEFEMGNTYFEFEDNCVLKDGSKADIIYRELDRFCRITAYVAEEHHSRNGYTTCFWHNLINSEILYDRDGRLKQAQERFRISYPEVLRESIIKRNFELLCNGMPCYYNQILKAVSRNDLVSVNHRTAAFMESYFDILFALNRLTHPGEKKLVEICRRDCRLLPEDFEENIERLFKELFTSPERVKDNLDALTGRMRELLERENIITGRDDK